MSGPVTPSGLSPETAVHDRPIVLEVENLVKEFRTGPRKGLIGSKATLTAVDQVSFAVHRGETLGVVGESGCGKSTLARTLLCLTESTAGRIVFKGDDITHARGAKLRRLRRHLQVVFQDPYASLDPRMTVRRIVGEPMLAQGMNKDVIRAKVDELLDEVGLRPESADRYPHEFSGGQRQRIGIARALALEPDVIVLDEPVSALDVSVQAQIINLLRRLQRERDLTLLFIAHDLSVVRHMSDRVAVMYLGQVVEIAHRDALYEAPRHPYTIGLLSAVPIPDPEIEDARERIILRGSVPSPMNPPSGCRFHPRCFKAQQLVEAARPGFEIVESQGTRVPRSCAEQVPELIDVAGMAAATQHAVACHFPDDGTTYLATVANSGASNG